MTDEKMILDEPEFDPEEWERKREEEREKLLSPAKAAAKQRRESAAVIAEHDQLLADMLFEMTMNELEQ
jgi:hypothetical protein